MFIAWMGRYICQHVVSCCMLSVHHAASHDKAEFIANHRDAYWRSTYWSSFAFSVNRGTEHTSDSLSIVRVPDVFSVASAFWLSHNGFPDLI